MKVRLKKSENEKQFNHQYKTTRLYVAGI
jgi:hypothetical protein